MKTIKCNECGSAFEAETREEILKTLCVHYMKDHNEVITNVTEEDKKTWMARFEKEWAEAEKK
jgi:predicted small metal-binding protein